MIRERLCRVLLLGGIIGFVVSFNITNEVSAATKLSRVFMDKAALQGAYICYTGGRVKTSINPISEYKDMGSLINKKDTDTNYVPLASKPWNPSGSDDIRYIIKDDGLGCKQLFKGGIYGFVGLKGTNQGLLEAMGKSAPSDKTELLAAFLRNMGYTVTDKSGKKGGECYKLSYAYKDGMIAKPETHNTNTVCKDSNKIYTEGKGDYGASFTVKDKNKVCFSTPVTKGACATFNSNKDTFSGAWLKNVMVKDCGSDKICDNANSVELLKIVYDFSNTMVGGYKSGGSDKKNDYEATIKASRMRSAAGDAVRFLGEGLKNGDGGTGITPGNMLVSTDTQKRTLYQYYLTEIYNVTVKCDENDSDKNTIYWVESGAKEVKVCHYKKNDKTKNTKVNGVDGSGWYKYKSITSQQKLIDAINALGTDYDSNEADALNEAGYGGGNSTGEDEDEDAEDTCVENAGAGALNWVICPAFLFISESTERLYNEVVEPSLQVSPKLFQINDEGKKNDETGINVDKSATEYAWSRFRDMANIAFVVILLIVILSQLTGFGIDNYGIKKILPKLVVVAILVNLSYVISLLAVDVSNILGNGFQSLFKGLSEALSGGEDGWNLTVDGNPVSGLVYTGAGILAGAASAIAIVGNPAVFLSLIVSAIGIAVAVAFTFVLLMAREAIIIVLVVISPLAMVAYALPNTKKLFDKWFSTFKTMLMLYPICGLLIGAGEFVATLILETMADKGFVALLSAMIVSVVPIFFIPSLVKSALSAMGKIGSSLAGMGDRLGRGTANGMRNTRVYKGLQEQGQEFGNRYYAGVGLISGKPKKVGRLGTVLRGGKRNMARARAQYRKDQTDRESDRQLLNNEIYDSRLESDRKAMLTKGFQEQFANMSGSDLRAEASKAGTWLNSKGGEERMSALIEAMESQGLEGDIFDMLRSNNVSDRDGVMSTLAKSNNKVLKAYGKRGQGVSYNNFMTGTGRASLQGYAADKGGDFVNGLDDKALEEISVHSAGSMSTEQLVQAAHNLNDEASMQHINNMLSARNDLDGHISGEDLAGFNQSTLERLAGNPNASAAISSAAVDLAGNQQLMSKVSEGKQRQIISAMNNTDLENFATNPGLAMDNSLRSLAEAEVNRRGMA